MSEKDALQRAADEARKVARAAREFAGICDEYAKYLTQRTWQGRAEELRILTSNKLTAINDGLATCNNWVIESGKLAVARATEQIITNEVSKTQDTKAPRQPRAVRIKRKENQK
ncbi:MAG TPA: hypothetical protein VGN95_18115 [Pyrinomonadaceae bacterium]|jgi:hypothetical protein|nr:hypothetical protein [Pyrinomonadaceae bacterium]